MVPRRVNADTRAPAGSVVEQMSNTTPDSAPVPATAPLALARVSAIDKPILRHPNALRSARGSLSQREAAEALGLSQKQGQGQDEKLGRGQSLYSMLETGMVLPSPEMLERLCDLFKCGIADLYPDSRVQSFYNDEEVS